MASKFQSLFDSIYQDILDGQRTPSDALRFLKAETTGFFEGVVEEWQRYYSNRRQFTSLLQAFQDRPIIAVRPSSHDRWRKADVQRLTDDEYRWDNAPDSVQEWEIVAMHKDSPEGQSLPSLIIGRDGNRLLIL